MVAILLGISRVLCWLLAASSLVQFLHLCLQMLQQGCDVNCCDYDGRTGLMLAASKGVSTVVKQLIVAGAAVNATDHNGNCALLEACNGGHDQISE